MKKIETIIFTRKDLVDKKLDFELINRNNFDKETINKSGMVLFIDDNGDTKILKNRYGNFTDTKQLDKTVEGDMCFFPKTKELLENEIKIYTESRDGVGKAWNLLKRDGIEDEHLRKLYLDFDVRLKEYSLSIDALMEESMRGCACS